MNVGVMAVPVAMLPVAQTANTAMLTAQGQTGMGLSIGGGHSGGTPLQAKCGGGGGECEW